MTIRATAPPAPRKRPLLGLVKPPWDGSSALPPSPRYERVLTLHLEVGDKQLNRGQALGAQGMGLERTDWGVAHEYADPTVAAAGQRIGTRGGLRLAHRQHGWCSVGRSSAWSPSPWAWPSPRVAAAVMAQRSAEGKAVLPCRVSRHEVSGGRVGDVPVHPAGGVEELPVAERLTLDPDAQRQVVGRDALGAGRTAWPRPSARRFDTWQGMLPATSLTDPGRWLGHLRIGDERHEQRRMTGRTLRTGTRHRAHRSGAGWHGVRSC